jgi:hypothetical protein
MENMNKIRFIKILREVEVTQADIYTGECICCHRPYSPNLSLKKAKEIADKLFDRKEEWCIKEDFWESKERDNA